MQVDLFKSRAFLENYQKIGSQVETRKFAIDPARGSIDDIGQYVVCYNDNALEEYKNKLKKDVENGRSYRHIGAAGSDSLFEVEALGIAKYCKKYVAILDLSCALDYVLHRLCKCNMEAVRNIEEYQTISYAIMNYDFERTEQILFDSFFQVDPRLDEYFIRLLESTDDVTISSDNRMNWVINRFYMDILGMANNIKNYTMTFMQSRLKSGTFAYRSKSFSSALAATSNLLDEQIIFHQDGYEDYNVELRCYEPFGYVRGRIFI